MQCSRILTSASRRGLVEVDLTELIGDVQVVAFTHRVLLEVGVLYPRFRRCAAVVGVVVESGADAAGLALLEVGWRSDDGNSRGEEGGDGSELHVECSWGC